MKMKNLYLLGFLALFLTFFSCKKDDKTNSSNTTNNETLDAAASNGMTISTQMQSFVLSSIAVAADSGYFFEFPQDTSGHMLKSASGINDDGGWMGPDAQGWYTRYITGGMYDYYEKLRKTADTIEYMMEISYDGGDGSYSSTTNTKYYRKVKDGKTLYDGYSNWEVKNNGYNLISDWEWQINFTDWNPATSAGIYDWYWGVSENSGGNTVPYHRFMHMAATETTPDGWLQCHVIFYDDSGSEVWDFEYDTPWVPVEMPEIPGWK